MPSIGRRLRAPPAAGAVAGTRCLRPPKCRQFRWDARCGARGPAQSPHLPVGLLRPTLPSPSFPGRPGRGAPSGPHESGAAAGGPAWSPRCPRYACVRPAGTLQRGSAGLKGVGSEGLGGQRWWGRHGVVLLPRRGTRGTPELREPPGPQGPGATKLLVLLPPRRGGLGMPFDYDLRSDETTR